MSKERMSITVSPRTRQMVEILGERADDDSMSETIRNAVRLFHHVSNALDDGASLVHYDADGNKTVIPDVRLFPLVVVPDSIEEPN